MGIYLLIRPDCHYFLHWILTIPVLGIRSHSKKQSKDGKLGLIISPAWVSRQWWWWSYHQWGKNASCPWQAVLKHYLNYHLWYSFFDFPSILLLLLWNPEVVTTLYTSFLFSWPNCFHTILKIRDNCLSSRTNKEKFKWVQTFKLEMSISQRWPDSSRSGSIKFCFQASFIK